jgi:hypothetical protein
MMLIAHEHMKLNLYIHLSYCDMRKCNKLLRSNGYKIYRQDIDTYALSGDE